MQINKRILGDTLTEQSPCISYTMINILSLNFCTSITFVDRVDTCPHTSKLIGHEAKMDS